MDRRGFLKSFALLGAATAAGAGILIPEPESRKADITFEEGFFQRHFNGEWELIFASDEPFQPTGKKELVLEIRGQRFLLKSLEVVGMDELIGKPGRYSLRGRGWELL